ncbi:hypothetical protein IFM89_021555, partial [Coptis chinensis]
MSCTRDDHALKLPYENLSWSFNSLEFNIEYRHRMCAIVSRCLNLNLLPELGEQSSLEAPIVCGNRNRCHVPGVLYNPNTLESFRALDKQSLLNSEANK